MIYGRLIVIAGAEVTLSTPDGDVGVVATFDKTSVNIPVRYRCELVPARYRCALVPVRYRCTLVPVR